MIYDLAALLFFCFRARCALAQTNNPILCTVIVFGSFGPAKR
jgi:hypothetical protein